MATQTKRKRFNPKQKRAKESGDIPRCTVFCSELGWILVGWQDDKVTRISFGHSSPAEATKHGECEPIAVEDAPKWIERLVEKIKKFAAGKNVDWGQLPLAPGKQTEFQQKVQDTCRKIPRGEVWSYGELAAAVGSPGAARAVGSVMRTNRFPLIVPCHRVVAAGGKLGGFSCPAGIDMKLKLLAAEGVEIKGLGTKG